MFSHMGFNQRSADHASGRPALLPVVGLRSENVNPRDLRPLLGSNSEIDGNGGAPPRPSLTWLSKPSIETLPDTVPHPAMT